MMLRSTAKVQIVLMLVSACFANLAWAGDKWIFMEKSMTWYDAVKNAPSGYHLPQRYEILKAYDSSEFKNINTQIWTATERDDLKAWYVILSNKPGYLVSESKLNDKRNEQFVGYVADEAEAAK